MTTYMCLASHFCKLVVEWWDVRSCASIPNLATVEFTVAHMHCTGSCLPYRCNNELFEQITKAHVALESHGEVLIPSSRDINYDTLNR